MISRDKLLQIAIFKSFIYIYIYIYIIHLFNFDKVRYTIPVYCRNSFPYKDKMLIKANGAIKSIINKNVKTNKLNFRAKIMKKTNFQCCKKILLIKQKTLLKKTKPIKVLFAQSARAACGFPQVYSSFEFQQAFQFFHFIWYKSPNFRAKKFNTLCSTKIVCTGGM